MGWEMRHLEAMNVAEMVVSRVCSGGMCDHAKWKQCTFPRIDCILCLSLRIILLFLVALRIYFSYMDGVRSLCMARFSIATHSQGVERNAESLNGVCARPITALRGGYKEDLINRVMNEC
jgi:hypothetical protein